MTAGTMLPIYRFGDGVVDGKDLKITNDFISIPSIKSGSFACEFKIHSLI